MLTNDELHEVICMESLPSYLTAEDQRELGEQVINQVMDGDSPEFILRSCLQFIYARGGQREMAEFIDACEADMMKTMGLSSEKDKPDDELS